MLEVAVKHSDLFFGDSFALNFQRTLRIPDDGKTYPLPPGLGTFPICKVEDYQESVPSEWVEHGGVFIPMYQREALWISFLSRYWKPNAVKIAVGKVNAVSGKPWDQRLFSSDERGVEWNTTVVRQAMASVPVKKLNEWLANYLKRTRQAKRNDYLVCPPQPWLDGINVGKGHIRQFVAMPLGMEYTVEAQVIGEEKFGGIQIIVYEPKPGKFPDQPPAGSRSHRFLALQPTQECSLLAELVEMGVAAGGKMKQKIYPDPYGIDTWDEENYGRVYVHIVNSMMYREITGKEPPPTPVTTKTYTKYGLPWFDLYDDKMGDISAPEVLNKVKTVKEMDKEKGCTSQQDDKSIVVPEDKIIKYKIDSKVKDGNW
jgi:hypothetical protein